MLKEQARRTMPPPKRQSFLPFLHLAREEVAVSQVAEGSQTHFREEAGEKIKLMLS
jgi:hypothetical protein